MNNIGKRKRMDKEKKMNKLHQNQNFSSSDDIFHVILCFSFIITFLFLLKCSWCTLDFRIPGISSQGSSKIRNKLEQNTQVS